MLRRSRSRLASGQISASLYIVSKAGIPAGSSNQGRLLRVKMWTSGATSSGAPAVASDPFYRRLAVAQLKIGIA